jgi:hypothetical protein
MRENHEAFAGRAMVELLRKGPSVEKHRRANVELSEWLTTFRKNHASGLSHVERRDPQIVFCVG